MSIMFSASEIVETAVRIEENGFAFYNEAAKLVKDEKTADIFNYLAGEEKKHIEIFQNLLQGLETEPLPPSEIEEYDHYMKYLTDENVFTREVGAEKVINQIQSDVDALNLAIDIEKDSILFYSGLKRVAKKSDYEVIDKVINEEFSHLVKLSAIKSQLI